MTVKDGFDNQEDFHIISEDKKFGMLENRSGRIYEYSKQKRRKLQVLLQVTVDLPGRKSCCSSTRI
jgi:hypothetical protein